MSQATIWLRPKKMPPSAASAPPSIHTMTDDALDVDARGLGQVLVVGHRPHGPADAGVLEHEPHAEDHDDREHDDDQVARRDRDRPEVQRLLDDVLGVGLRLGLEEQEDHVAQQQRQADRDDEHLDQPGPPVAQRSPQPQLGRATEECRRRRWRERRDDEGQPAVRWLAALKKNATIAPIVTYSPWAKLISRVVPNTSERPIAVIAMIAPYLMPSTSAWARSPPEPDSPEPARSTGSGCWSRAWRWWSSARTGRDQREQDVLDLARTHDDALERVAALVAQHDRLRQRRGVERDVERAVPGRATVQVPSAPLVAVPTSWPPCVTVIVTPCAGALSGPTSLPLAGPRRRPWPPARQRW